MVKSLIWMYLVEIMNMSYDGVQRFRELIINNLNEREPKNNER